MTSLNSRYASPYFKDTNKDRVCKFIEPLFRRKGRVRRFIEASVCALRVYAFIPCFFKK